VGCKISPELKGLKVSSRQPLGPFQTHEILMNRKLSYSDGRKEIKTKIDVLYLLNGHCLQKICDNHYYK
jgi:hypothetical protein